MPPLDPDLRALQEVRDAVARAREAQRAAALWDQARTDSVCEAVVRAGARAAHDLARVAVEETGIGRVHHKILKNLFGTEGTWASIKDERTVGILRRDARSGVVEVGSPAGVVAGIIPTTNPTSTTLNNALINLKARNAIVFSPHPRARRCIGETAEVMRRALERAGAPPDLVISLSNPTVESTAALMKHRDVALILATGGSGLVRAAYSSGKPAFGVGPGNVPVYVDRSADVKAAARWLVASQSFDNGTLCCSEQALVVDRPVLKALLAELAQRGAHLCDEQQTKLLEASCVAGGMMSPEVVGKDPHKVASGAGFRVPRHTTLLLAPQAGVGREFPLSGEVLCPLLSLHVVDGWEEGCEVSMAILHHGGLGHTIGLWSRDDAVLDAWFLEKPASRIVVNGPTSQGAVGYSTGLVPAMSLGCGPHAGNITSDNISARHMINVKRAGLPSADWEARYEADMGRASRMTGQGAVRGSGLAGDPALTGNAVGPRDLAAVLEAAEGLRARGPSAEASPAGSAPPVTWTDPAGARAAAGPRSARAAAPAATPTIATVPAPRFSTGAAGSPGAAAAGGRPALLPAGTLAGTAPPASSRPAPAARASAERGPYVGMALTPAEIEGILDHAGAGCPLGPCRGCPHNDPVSGACTA